MRVDTEKIRARLDEGLDLYFCDDCDYVGPGVQHTNPHHHCHHVGYSLGDRKEISERARTVLAAWLGAAPLARACPQEGNRAALKWLQGFLDSFNNNDPRVLQDEERAFIEIPDSRFGNRQYGGAGSVGGFRAAAQALREDVAALLGEVARLREALQPFATACSEYEAESADYVITDGLQIDGESAIAHPILWGDLRRARDVLAP